MHTKHCIEIPKTPMAQSPRNLEGFGKKDSKGFNAKIEVKAREGAQGDQGFFFWPSSKKGL